MAQIHFPADSTAWAAAATEGATTWPHTDDYRMATLVKVMAGRKFWVVMRPKIGETSKDAWIGHLSNNVDHYDCKGVLLDAGDTL
jgi:hypothetical protein